MLRPKAIRTALAALSLILFGSSAPALELAQDLTTHDWEAIWAGLLSRHVSEKGRIDFSALQQDHGDLDRVVSFVATVDPLSQPNRFPDAHSRLSYYINAYNALAMYGVLQAGTPASLGGLTKFTFFYLRKFKVGGNAISLYELENWIIRPIGDERVHFALNCMVVSCPRLPRLAFSATTLDRQLDSAARTFIGEGRNVAVDPIGHEVWLSSIFKFYTEDFWRMRQALSPMSTAMARGFQTISRFAFSITTGPSMTATGKEHSDREIGTMGSVVRSGTVRTFQLACRCAISDGIPRRSLYVALVVGTILNLINQGDALGDGSINWLKAALTYVVPYVVCTYGAISARLQLRRPDAR